MTEKDRNIEQQANLLEGDIIKEIFKSADSIAILHQTISSPRGIYYRRRLLQLTEAKTPLLVVEKLSSEAGAGQWSNAIIQYAMDGDLSY